jgi:hypothetical protein
VGIESDQVVYEYLSRVGDVAQQRQLPSAARMRLVSELRNEIERRRAKAPLDSPAAVRRIISRLGSPDEVVEAAGGTGGGAQQAPATSVPVQRAGTVDASVDKESDDGGRPKGLRRVVPRPRPAQAAPSPEPSEGPSPPHLAGVDELGDSATQPDWWRVDSSPFGVGDSVPGFVGGVEIPELLKPPPPKETAVEKPAPALEKAEEAEAVVEAPARRRRRFLRPLRGKGTGAGTGTGSRWTNPLLLLAAGLLVAGAILGNLFALLLGWVIAYASRRLSAAETKWAVMILPGLSVTAGIVWLWGRAEGRWAPIAEGQMNEAVAETWPWVVRGAAVASALFLVWRSQKQR